ncbi:PHP domain-like protein [Ascodesmis nigricans]|uniref:PHP domain-like protein n=1 Tax=Ascodesmis nigricans TaxID=341454 RepID=A0A4S2MLD9_9PEZI|nr:PHP domain-like protein [Ascodesmis nigricans]
MSYDPNIPSTITVTPERQSPFNPLISPPQAKHLFTYGWIHHHLPLPHPLRKASHTTHEPAPHCLRLPLSPPTITILRHATALISDPSTNPRLPQLSQHYDIVALRPTTEKLLLQACQSLDADLISPDFSQLLPFHLKHKIVGLALSKRLCFEVCYRAGIADATARRNLVQNVQGLIRAIRNGRGIVISSKARKVAGLRAPHDVVNLACLWGLSQEKARDAVVVVGEMVRNEKKRKAEEAVQDGKMTKSSEQQGQASGDKLSKTQRRAKVKAASGAGESTKT